MCKTIINLAQKWSYLHRLFYFAFVYFGQRVWDPWTIQWHKEHSQHVEIVQSKMSSYASFEHQLEYWLWPEDQPKKIIMNILEKTSLKIFKHYKLKPSFPIIIKHNKTKDRAGVGDKPPPPSFVRSINPNFIQKLIRTDITQFRFDPIWSILIQLDLIWTDYLIWFDPI